MTTFEENIRKKLIELINKEPRIRTDEAINLPFYVRFQPQFLYDLLPELRAAGLVDEKDNLKRNLLFLFEFALRSRIVMFDCKINWKSNGIAYNEGARQKLFRIYMKYPQIFTRIADDDGKLSEKWHPALQREILSREEFEFYSQNPDKDVSDLLESRFRKVVDTDMKAIEKVFYKEFK
jgi:hypothetical protein